MFKRFFLLFKSHHHFLKLLFEKGYKNTWDFVETRLMLTNEKDWEIDYDGDWMFCYAVPGIVIRFSNDTFPTLNFYNGKNSELIFWITCGEFPNWIESSEDPLTGKDLTEKEEKQMLSVVHYIKSLHESLSFINKQIKKQEECKQAETFAVKKEREKAALFTLMELNNWRENILFGHDFWIEKNVVEEHCSLKILFENVLYFQALQPIGESKIHFNIHNTNIEDVQIFMESEEALRAFAQRTFAESKPDRSVRNDTVLTKTFHEDLADPLQVIQKTCAVLQQEQEWLSVESHHYLNETLPNHLKKFNHVYQVLEEKKAVQKDVAHFLQQAFTKLQALKDEVETNKQNEFKKILLLMEQR